MGIMMSRILSVHNEHEFLLKLETAGLNEELAQKVISSKDNELAVKMVRFIQSGGFEFLDKTLTSLNPIWLRAREIMGKNFFGIEEAMQHFGINPSHQQLLALSNIPFSEAMLQTCKNTHVLMAVFPLSILEICNKVEQKLFYHHEGVWYNEESFAKKRSKANWQLVCKTSVPDSISKNWQQQQALISKDNEVPTARVMFYTIIGHYLATSERLFEYIYVRTLSLTSKTSSGGHVIVGDFDSCLTVGSRQDVFSSGDLGLSSARKF